MPPLEEPLTILPRQWWPSNNLPPPVHQEGSPATPTLVCTQVRGFYLQKGLGGSRGGWEGVMPRREGERVFKYSDGREAGRK